MMEWISAKDKLPDLKRCEILVACEGDVFSAIWKDNNFNYHCCETGCCPDRTFTPNYWSYLPKLAEFLNKETKNDE